MKKIFMGMLFLASPVFADIAVTPGVGKTVHTDTVNSVEYQDIKIIDGTTGGTSSMTVTAGGAIMTVSTGTAVNNTVTTPIFTYQNNVTTVTIPGSIQTTLSTVTFNGTAQPVNVLNSTMAVVGVGPFNVTGSSVGIVGMGVTGDSATFTLGVSSVVPIGGVYLTNVPVINSTTTAALRIGHNRNLYVTAMDENGVILGTGTANPIFVTSTLTNSTIAVVGVGPFNVTGSSVGVNNTFATPLFTYQNNVTTVSIINSTMAIVGANLGATALQVYQTNLGTTTIINSTMAVTQTGALWTIGNSTIATVGIGPFNVTGSTTGSVGTLSDNGVAAGTNRVPTLPAIYQKAYLQGTAATQNNNAALSVGTDGNLFVALIPDLSTGSYSASTNTWTMTTSSMDASAVCGNATNMVMVTGLRVACTQSTAGIVPITVAKRSSAYVGPWSSMTFVGDDSNYAAPISTAIYFTAGGSGNGTLLGYVDSAQIGCMAGATATPNDIYISPAEWRTKPIVLRGTTQCLGFNFQGTSMSGAKITAAWKIWEVHTVSP